ncbi:MAG: thioredoxin [Candidatus Woesearchaeota archaeon]
MMEVLTDATFDKAKKGNVVLDFYADWCGPCRMFAPTFEKVSKELTTVHLFKVDTEQSPMVSTQYGIRSIPTIAFLKDGKEVHREMGVLQEADFKAVIKKIFG